MRQLAVYRLFKQLPNGEFVYVASHEELGIAVHTLKALRDLWPGEYLVRDSEGNVINVKE